jgi:hypothetical protein
MSPGETFPSIMKLSYDDGSSSNDFEVSLVHDGGDVWFSLHARRSGQHVLDISRGSREFSQLAELLGISRHISLLVMEHDLDPDCECRTCSRVSVLKDIHG